MKKSVNKIIAKAALAVAKVNANSTCPYTFYQPKIPKTVKKLRKF